MLTFSETTARRGTSCELDMASAPIDEGVVILEPGHTDDHIFLAKVGDVESFVRSVLIDIDCELGSGCDGTVLVFRIVGIIDVYGVQEWNGGDVVSFAERGVYVSGSCAGIEECVNVVSVSVTVDDFDFYGGKMGMEEGG